MNTIKLEIECTGITADFGLSDDFEIFDMYIDVWDRIGKYFDDKLIESNIYYRGDEIKIRFNVCVDSTYLITSRQELKKDTFDLLTQGKFPQRTNDSKLFITFTYDEPHERFLRYAISNFFETFFLAANLCVPGSCDFGFTEYQCNYDKIIIPKLSSQQITNAWVKSRSWNWPTFRQINFNEVWDWIHRVKLPETHVSNNSIQRALITILNICSAQDGWLSYLNNILWISNALESLLVQEHDGIQRLLKERIESILGVPESNNKWINKFYGIRSRIIHGDLNVIRAHDNELIDPKAENYGAPFDDIIDRSLAVLIALIRVLIEKNGTNYTFKQSYIIETKLID